MSWFFAATALADPIGHLLLVEGEVTVARGDEELPGRQGIDLKVTDSIRTGDDGSVIVLLYNDHLVRVDGSLELPLEKMVLLKAPRATTKPGAQLANLLVSTERQGYGGMVRKVETLGGWEARMQVSSPIDRGGPNAVARGTGGAAPALAPGPTLPKTKRDAPKPRPPQEELATDKVAGDAPAPRSLDEMVAPYQPGEALHVCIATWNDQLGLHTVTDSVEIVVEVEDGSVESVRTTEWISPPPCLRDALLGKPINDTSPVKIELETPPN